ncbi:MAG TPA: hypothetical protein VGQ06_03815 [Gemmatimonadales bacterium]|jgi:hypothetical protein|nr:hypothetical protein [Gemmatimonadales bacterium]
MFAVLLAVAAAATQQLDSAAYARVTVALRGVQDSLDRVRGAAYNFRTDLGGASPVVVYGRAQRMHASCVAADRALAGLDSVLIASYPAGRPAALRREVRTLRAALAECRREYDTTTRWAQRADSVRSWAPYRLRRLDEAVRRYTEAARPPR